MVVGNDFVGLVKVGKEIDVISQEKNRIAESDCVIKIPLSFSFGLEYGEYERKS